jgi:tetratricopeptide (TPR) repeat protein
MGRVYQNLGDYERSGTLLEKALAVRRREQGERHPDVGRTLGRLGGLRGMYQGRPADAKPLLLEALSIQSEAYGPRHVETAWALYYLGSALSWEPDPCGSVYLERAREIFEDTLGAESLPVSWCWQDLSNYFWGLGQYDRALECVQRATKIKELRLPAGEPDIAISQANAAYHLVRLGRYEEARQVLEVARKTFLTALGPRHDQTAASLRMLADLQRGLGDYDEARENASHAARVLLDIGGPENVQYAEAQYVLALVALETGRLAEADSLTRVAFAVIEKVVDRDSPYMAEYLELRAGSLRKIGRAAEAAVLEDSTRAIRRRWGGAACRTARRLISPAPGEDR